MGAILWPGIAIIFLIISFLISECRADVVLTDLDPCLPLLEKNISLNRHLLEPKSLLESRRLRWGDPEDLKSLEAERGPFDLVLLSDCIYYGDSLGPLVETLEGIGAEVLVSYEVRESEQKKVVQDGFFRLVKEKGFTAEEFPTSDCHPDYASPDIKVLRLERKGR